MMNYVISQFKQPRGPLGQVAGWMMARNNQARNAWAIELLDVQPADQVLEIGFGPGIGIKMLAEKATLGKVTGIDPSAVMARQAGQRNARAIKEGRVALQVGGVEALDFPENSFDKAFSSNTFMFWPKPAENLHRVHQALKPGGVLAITVQPRWLREDAEIQALGEEIATQLWDNGYTVVEVEFKQMQPMSAICVLGRK